MPVSAPRISPFIPLCLVLILAGCSDNRVPLGPSRTQGAAELSDALRPGSNLALDAQSRLKPDLSNIWPNEDGRYWIYTIQERAWGNPPFDPLFDPRTYPTAAQVPPAPRLLEVAALLRSHPIGANPVLSTAFYRMQFNGIKTTQSGAVGQNLETRIIEEVGIGPAAVQVGPAAVRVGTAAMPPGFLRTLSVARPDLARKLAAKWGTLIRTASTDAAASIDPPNFLFGYAWEKTSEYIGSYGDLNTQLAWRYLVANLRPGSSFVMQLIPDLADDVFLHARVLTGNSSRTEFGTFRNAVRVLYLIDFGVSTLTDVDGNSLGYFRVYSYGTVDYVPGVGPVASYERALVQPGRPLDPGIYDQRIGLVATGAGAPIP